MSEEEVSQAKTLSEKRCSELLETALRVDREACAMEAYMFSTWCIYIHPHMYVYLYQHVYMYIHVFMSVYIDMHICIHIYVQICVNISVCK